MSMRTAFALLLLCSTACAQQPIPLTDWRAQVDAEIGKLNMTREEHGKAIGFMQRFEQQAQQEKMTKLPAPGTVLRPLPGSSQTEGEGK